MKIEITSTKKDKKEFLKANLAILSLIFLLSAVFSFMLFIGIEKENEAETNENKNEIAEVFAKGEIHEFLGFSDTPCAKNEEE